MVLKDELDQMQNRLKQSPLKELARKHPRKNSKAEIYQSKAALLREGNICFASIVQANSNMFKLFPAGDYPGQIIFCTDPYMAENPQVLKKFARQLYQYKYKPLESVPESLRLLVSSIADEYDYSAYQVTYTHQGHAMKIILTPVMLHRKLLPGRKLYGNLIPLIVAPDCRSIMVLPKEFWTRKFRSIWLQRLV